MTAAKKYAIENGFTHCRYYRDWMSYHVYIAFNGNTPRAGEKTFILYDGFECWFADTDKSQEIMFGRMHFSKNKKRDKIFWVDAPVEIGAWLFTFDKRKIFNMFRDYPYNLTAEQKEIFDRENPYWREFFAGRK